MKLKVNNLIYVNSYPLVNGDVFEPMIEDGDYFLLLDKHYYFMGDAEEVKSGCLIVMPDDTVITSYDILRSRVTENRTHQKAKQIELTTSELIGD